MERYLRSQIEADLETKMVFLGGPRQVGKTTLARQILGSSAGYLNWDIPSQREDILRRRLPDSPVWVFDELHKFRRWRNFLKGVFDEFRPQKKMLVTGSARLDLYRFGGDSLQGRYYYLKLHPLSFAEISGKGPSDLEHLYHLGGFPEPFLGGSLARARRWSTEYRNRLVRDDISSLEQIRDLGLLEQLILALPERVGSPLSLNALREDLQVNHQTVSRWIAVLERMYSIFRLMPFGSPKLRAVRKEQKHYHVDWALVPEEGARFENMVASHLLKWVDYQFDSEGRDIELRYFRDVDGREVDFVLVERRKPFWLIECKLSADSISPSLRYLKERFPEARALQLHLAGKREYIGEQKIEVRPAWKFLGELV
jgi:uncharacterized protein